MQEGHNEKPVNPVPMVVWLVLLPLIAMEIALSAAGQGLVGGAQGIGWRQEAYERFALWPQMLGDMSSTGRWQTDYLMRFVSYGYVHVNLTHALFVGVFTLALGKMVAEIFNPLAFLVIFFGGGIVGAVVYSLVPGLTQTLVGGYPAAYGLIGAFTFVLWARLGLEHANRARAFVMIGTLLGLQLLFGMLFGGGPDWIADLGGFAAGFGLSFLLVPGGPAALLARLRQR